MENEIKAAVEWWADILTRPPNHDNGDHSMHGQFTRILDMWATSNLKQLDAERIHAFKIHLTVILNEQAAERKHLYLGCDYDPCLELSQAATLAGIDRASERFPWKTNMWIKKDEVSVSCGYRAPTQTIYTPTVEA